MPKLTNPVKGLLVIMTVGLLLISGCSSASKSTGLTGTLNGSGSSFQAPFQEVMINAFQEKNSGITVNYGAGGSGKGKSDLHDQVVDFAGTDSLIKDADKASAKGGEILYFPIAAAPITISFNLKGVTDLQLSADTIAKIFEAKIKVWNDPTIAADNPGVNLPGTSITVVHRSDGSGTTNNFTGYLTKTAPSVWTLGRGDTVNWSVSTQAGNGNRGVAQSIEATNGAIGYVDFADAKAAKFTYARVKNLSGKYVAPTLEGVSAALESTTVKADLTYDPLNAPGESAYPIATPTWIIIYKVQPDKVKGAAIKAYLSFILTDGQTLAPDADYAPLSESIRQKAVDQLSSLV